MIVFFLKLMLPVSILIVSGCGTMTGIPSHGGGKRYAMEQELVAATARASAKALDVSALRGKRAAVYIVGMGDQGSGNLIGGRANLASILRGEIISTPVTEYPVVTTTTTTGAVTTIAENALNAPRRTDGSGLRGEVGVNYNGLGAYRSEAVLNPRDAQFLSAVLQESMVLRGVKVVDPPAANVDVYITVDVFGTTRSRTDFGTDNRETLIAKTALELAALDRKTGNVIVNPQMVAYEAEYSEKYVAWTGPVKRTQHLREAPKPLIDFSDINGPVREVYRELPLESSHSRDEAMN